MNLLLKRIAVGLLLAVAICGGDIPAGVNDAVKQLEQKAAKAPLALGIEFQVRAAQAVHSAWPELSRELTARSVAQLRSGVGWRITPDVMGALARLDPDDAISVLPRMDASYAEPVIDALGQLHRIDDARSVYRAALVRGARVIAAFSLFTQLYNEKSREIGAVYRDMLSGFSFDALDPEDAHWIDSELTRSVEEIDPTAAVEGTIRILEAASNPAYGKGTRGELTGDFQIGPRRITTTDSRDAVLLMAGARLFALAPAEFEKRKALFARWGGAGPILVHSIRSDSVPVTAKTVFTTRRIPRQTESVRSRVDELEDQPDLDDEAVVRLAAELQPLPPDWGKLYTARRLCEIALERKASGRALGAAASALMSAIRDCHPVLNPGKVSTSFSEDYIRVAELIRYAGVRTVAANPAVSAAEALLALRERVLEHSGFAVATLDGNPRTISAVPGKVTVISLVTNVCERWKAQCDRPLPALDEFYKESDNKSVAAFAIVEENRELFIESLDGETFSVPLFIDPDDKFTAVFAVPLRHETFLFNSQRKLVSCAIGSQTKDQLSQMVKEAGLK